MHVSKKKGFGTHAYAPTIVKYLSSSVRTIAFHLSTFMDGDCEVGVCTYINTHRIQHVILPTNRNQAYTNVRAITHLLKQLA